MPHQTATLYITQLDDRVTEKMLKDIFSMISPVHSVKINTQNQSGLVEFHERQGAEQALHAMDGRVVFGKKIHIHWSNQLKKQHYYTVLVNGLGQDVSSSVLKKAFHAYYPRHVEVIMDTTNKDVKNKSYGLIDFEHRQDAEKAMKEMDGHYLSSSLNGRHPIQCRWANHQVIDTIATTTSSINSGATTPTSTITSRPSTPQTPSFSTMPIHPSTTCRVTSNNMSYEQIFAQTPPYNTSVYVENLPNEVSEQDLVPHFQQYGYVSHIEMDENGATVTLDTHANASTAIFALQGFNMGGQAIELSWGTHTTNTDHPAMNYTSSYSSSAPSMSTSASPFLSSHVLGSTTTATTTTTRTMAIPAYHARHRLL
ncbi:unnamed protein product [Absidia cylindrospora]